MSIDMCLESYTAIASLDSPLVARSLLAAHSPWRLVGARSKPAPDLDFNEAVRQATAALPQDQAHALWLVDVCGCTYGDAAAATHSTPEKVGARVATARTSIAKRLTSTNR